MTDCPCCDGSGRHITGYCGDGCCAYDERCDACDGEGDVTEAQAAVWDDDRDNCEYASAY